MGPGNDCAPLLRSAIRALAPTRSAHPPSPAPPSTCASTPSTPRGRRASSGQPARSSTTPGPTPGQECPENRDPDLGHPHPTGVTRHKSSSNRHIPRHSQAQRVKPRGCLNDPATSARAGAPVPAGRSASLPSRPGSLTATLRWEDSTALRGAAHTDRGQRALRRTARFLAPPTSARPRFLHCAGSRVDHPVVGPLYRHDRTLTFTPRTPRTHGRRLARGRRVGSGSLRRRRGVHHPTDTRAPKRPFDKIGATVGRPDARAR